MTDDCYSSINMFVSRTTVYHKNCLFTPKDTFCKNIILFLLQHTALPSLDLSRGNKSNDYGQKSKVIASFRFGCFVAKQSKD